MKTLAKKYPDAYAQLRDTGFPAIAKMMTCFYRCVDMDRALGRTGASNQWFIGKNLPSQHSELLAQKFLDGSQTIKITAEPVPEPEPEPEPTSTTYLLVCPQGAEAKVQKVLSLMGCEVVEI